MHRARTDEERRRLLDQLKADFFIPPLLEHKYRVEEVIGEGSYGVVCSATNTETGERVAVKRIMSVFEEVPEATRTLRELKFLRLLKHHENIITIKDVLLPSDRDNFDDVFVVLELMPTDLTRVLRSRIELSPEHIRWLVFQLTRGIFFLHTSRVFHRDLKPSNILINARCDLRIVDFGLSRAAFDNQDPDFVFWTDYVATRWYRAPELIMTTSPKYTTAIDMWSVGCIFAEMLNNGRPMFPGHNPEDQLRLIINFCGTPPPEVIANVREPRIRSLLARMPICTPKPLTTVFPHADALALDLLERILEFDPDRRISAEEALKHPYLQMDTIVRGKPIDVEEFAFERQNLSIPELRTLFLEEILKYHPDRRNLYLKPADQPVLRYTPVDQASRFREAMVATQNGIEPPRAWESMPNQRLTHYYERAVPPPPAPTHSQTTVVNQPATEQAAMRVTATSHQTSGHTSVATAVAYDAAVRTTGDDQAQREVINEEASLPRYTKFSSVESASSAMAFRHDSGALNGGIASRRGSETLESMADTAHDMDVDGSETAGT